MSADHRVPPASAPAATPGEPLRISDDERARLPKLGVPDDTMVEGISHPPLRPEVQAELDAFREHLTWHREDSAPDCRFCTERDAKKRPTAPTATAGTEDDLQGQVVGYLMRSAEQFRDDAEARGVPPTNDFRPVRIAIAEALERAARVHGARPTGEEAETAERIIAAAREEIRALCNGDKRWRMCVPVESTDSDEVFGRLANLAEAQATALAALRARETELTAALVRVMAWNDVGFHDNGLPPLIVQDIRAALAPRQPTTEDR